MNTDIRLLKTTVIPAKAGIQFDFVVYLYKGDRLQKWIKNLKWIPAFAGMTVGLVFR